MRARELPTVPTKRSVVPTSVSYFSRIRMFFIVFILSRLLAGSELERLADLRVQLDDTLFVRRQWPGPAIGLNDFESRPGAEQTQAATCG